MTEIEILNYLKEIVSGLLVIDIEKIDADENLFDIGLNSITIMSLIVELEQEYSIDLSIVDFFKQPTLNGISKTLRNEINLR